MCLPFFHTCIHTYIHACMHTYIHIHSYILKHSYRNLRQYILSIRPIVVSCSAFFQFLNIRLPVPCTSAPCLTTTRTPQIAVWHVYCSQWSLQLDGVGDGRVTSKTLRGTAQQHNINFNRPLLVRRKTVTSRCQHFEMSLATTFSFLRTRASQ